MRHDRAAARRPSPFDVVIVHSFSRFFRDAFDMEFYVRKLAKNGIKLLSITQEIVVVPVPPIIERETFDATDSITICAFTTDPTEAPLFRLMVEPNQRNGLHSSSRLMVDKITTVPKSKVGELIGRLDDEDLIRLNQAVLVFLGLAVSPRTGRKGE